jgi:hypothetical protein
LGRRWPVLRRRRRKELKIRNSSHGRRGTKNPQPDNNFDKVKDPGRRLRRVLLRFRELETVVLTTSWEPLKIHEG